MFCYAILLGLSVVCFCGYVKFGFLRWFCFLCPVRMLLRDCSTPLAAVQSLWKADSANHMRCHYIIFIREFEIMVFCFLGFLLWFVLLVDIWVREYGFFMVGGFESSFASVGLGLCCFGGRSAFCVFFV